MQPKGLMVGTGRTQVWEGIWNKAVQRVPAPGRARTLGHQSLTGLPLLTEERRGEAVLSFLVPARNG
jgi:hypothetical protein